MYSFLNYTNGIIFAESFFSYSETLSIQPHLRKINTIGHI